METRRQIPASHGQPVDARHFTMFAIVCVLVVSMFGLVTSDAELVGREEPRHIEVQSL